MGCALEDVYPREGLGGQVVQAVLVELGSMRRQLLCASTDRTLIQPSDRL